MKPRKTFDCVEMKRKVPEKIHEETKDLSRSERIGYSHRHAQTGPFAELWKKPGKRVRAATATKRTKP
jgi:muconolactone delta-isomerase